MSFIFGPVPSRRLGRSLGIDVIPPKTCSYDCIYCESGRTTRLTSKKECFVDPERVLSDLDRYFREYPGGTDVLTLSSAGEPTLYAPLGDLLTAVKKRFPSLPLIVLTNGSLLWDAAVRRDLMKADRVTPSLDAVSRDVFLRINRPSPDLDLEIILEGMEAFRKEYRGELHLEVLLVSGVNDRPEELSKIRRMVDRIRPDSVELNTVVRPPAHAGCKGLSARRMEESSAYFPAGLTQIVGHFKGPSLQAEDLRLSDRIASMVERRPCTVSEMEASLGVSGEELRAALGGLLSGGLLKMCEFDGREYVTRGRDREETGDSAPCRK